MLTMIGAIATFERELMLERQAEGIELARRRGVYKGRKPTAMAKGKRCWRWQQERSCQGRNRTSDGDQSLQCAADLTWWG